MTNTFDTLAAARIFAKANGLRVFRRGGTYTQPGRGIVAYIYYVCKK